MKIDRTLANEIEKKNGDGSREDRFAFLREIIAVKTDCSTPDVRYRFADCFGRHSRAAIAVCVAATVLDRRDRLDRSTVDWGEAIMRLWTNRTPSTDRIIIEDNLHPTRIEEYAGEFIRLTSDN